MSEISKLEQNLIIKKIDKKTVNISITNNETFTIKYAITIDITGDVLPS